jgi:hypothetical protein
MRKAGGTTKGYPIPSYGVNMTGGARGDARG